MKRDGARAPTFRLNGGASKGLLSLRFERKSDSVVNRLDMFGARRDSRFEAALQWRRLKWVYLLSLRLERKSGPAGTRHGIIGVNEARAPKLRLNGGASKGLLSLRLRTQVWFRGEQT